MTVCAYNIVAQKMCHVKVFLYICVTKHAIGVLCLERIIISRNVVAFIFKFLEYCFRVPRFFERQPLIILFICLCIYVRRCICVNACLYYFPVGKKFIFLPKISETT